MASSDVRRGTPEEFRPLLDVCLALRPYLPELVVVGGWVPAVYARYGNLDWQSRLSRTREIDVLAIPPISREADRPPLDVILRMHGLRPRQHSGVSAVWSASPEEGIEIEFLTPKPKTADQQRAISLGDHGAVGAIPLEDLQVMAAYTATLTIPVVLAERPEIRLRVPQLGAYVLNKVITFPKRPRPADHTANPKQAKDLVYLRDIMAAGPQVVAQVEADLRTLRAETANTSLIRVARSTLGLLLSPQAPSWLGLPTLAARQVVEREGGDLIGREAELRGYLRELHQLLT